MGQKYLIDTNVISHLFAAKIPEKGTEFVREVINSEFIISVVVEIEVLSHTDDPNKMLLVEEFVSLATIIPLDKVLARKAIELRRKHRKLKLGDAIIASTAILNELTLLTNNIKDFSNIKGLKIIDPHTI